MASESEVELKEFSCDSLNTGDTFYVHDFFNDSWKKAIALELDLEEREILVQYDDRSQEWIRMDGTKMCLTPPVKKSKPPPVAVPSPQSSIKKSARIATNARSIAKIKQSSQSKSKAPSKKLSEAKSSSKESVDCKSTARDDPDETNDLNEDIDEDESPSNENSTSKSRSTKSNNKMDITLGKREPSGQFKKRKSASENAPIPKRKSTTKLKIRFGKTNDLSLLSRRKGKSRNEDMFNDANDEMSVVLNDEKLPAGWSKHMVRRKTSNKWDVIILNEDEKKFRSRNEIKAYYESLNQPFPEESFDFSSGRRSSSSKTLVEKNQDTEVNESLPFLSNKRKIKTLLPRRSLAETPIPSTPTIEASCENNEMQLAVSVTPFSNVPDVISTLTLQATASGSSGYICPKQECKKHCRTENLLMMHIKHYHPEYRSMLSSMPNVADLAYARTVGQSIDTPQSNFLEKIAKIEDDKMKEKTDGDREDTTIEDDFTLKVETDDEEKSPQTDKSSLQKLIKKSTPVKKAISSPSPASPSSSSSVLRAQLNQPPLIPPSISIQSEHTDTEISVSQNSPIAIYSPKAQNKDANVKSSPLSETDSGRKSTSPRKRRLSQLDDGEVINCTCGYGFEDGLMMQCDLCMCWQHGACNSVENEEDAPSPYICSICQNPRRIRSSKKFVYVQNWMKYGKIPKLEFSKTTDEVLKRREKFIQRTHEFLCNLTELKNAVHSLQVKCHILRQTPDHPKLYLWAKSWNDKKKEEKKDIVVAESGPVPEAAINMADCRKHLSEHIDEEIEKAEAMLQNIEDKIDKLEDDDDFLDDPDKFKNIVKQTLMMMIRDLSSVQNLKYCS